MELSKLSLRLRATTFPVALGLVLTGAFVGGPVGALVGSVVGGGLQLVCWWAAYLIVVHRRKSEGKEES
jgi:hypothetical protein